MIYTYLLAFSSAFVFTALLTPLSIILGRQLKLLDYPSERKIHKTPLPRSGGIALIAGFILTIILLLILSKRFNFLLDYRYKFFYTKDFFNILSISNQLKGIIAGGVLVFLIGIIDDRYNVRAITKFLVEIIAGYIAIDYGVRIFGISIPFKDKYIIFPLILSQVFTILWILVFINSINLIDGIDGLATGLVAIASLTFLIISIHQSSFIKIVFYTKQLKFAGVISAILLGMCFGFLIFNFPPAKIFLGDSGSLLLGYLLGTTTVIGMLKTTAFIALIIPVIILGLPVIDTIFAIFRRKKRRVPLSTPDKEHIHHKLLSRGWTQREVLFLFYIFAIALSEIAIILSVLKMR